MKKFYIGLGIVVVLGLLGGWYIYTNQSLGNVQTVKDLKIGISFEIPRNWIASTSPDGSINYQSADYTRICAGDTGPDAFTCKVTGQSLSVSSHKIDPSIQNPTSFRKWYMDLYSDMTNGEIDTTLSAPAADAVIVAKIYDVSKSQPTTNYIEEAHLLKGGIAYDFSVVTETSFEDSRNILATALQSLK